MSWNSSYDAGKAMYSTALAAFMAGKKVLVRLDGKTCYRSYDKTAMIRILKDAAD